MSEKKLFLSFLSESNALSVNRGKRSAPTGLSNICSQFQATEAQTHVWHQPDPCGSLRLLVQKGLCVMHACVCANAGSWSIPLRLSSRENPRPFSSCCLFDIEVIPKLRVWTGRTGERGRDCDCPHLRGRRQTFEAVLFSGDKMASLCRGMCREAGCGLRRRVEFGRQPKVRSPV